MDLKEKYIDLAYQYCFHLCKDFFEDNERHIYNRFDEYYFKINFLKFIQI